MVRTRVPRNQRATAVRLSGHPQILVGQLDDVQAKPLGSFGLRCAYLENLLKYIELCGQAQAVNQIQIREAQYALDQAKILGADADDERSRNRVHCIIESANQKGPTGSTGQAL